MNEIDAIKNKIKSKAYAAMLDIKYLCERLESKHQDEQTNLIRSVYCLTSAKGNISCAEAIYYANYDELGDYKLDELFHLFDRFCDELVDAIYTDHAKQYVYIYADELLEKFNDSVFCDEDCKIEILYEIDEQD